MLQIREISSLDDLDELKAEYMKRTTSALDGMWLVGFTAIARHFGLYIEDKLSGYFCINEEGYLLQYILNSNHSSQMSEMFKIIIETNSSEVGLIKGAFCSTAEPSFMSVCLDHFNSHKVNSLMYSESKTIMALENNLEMTLLDTSSIELAVDFANESIGAAKEWLRGYYSNLIGRKELYAYLKNGKILAVGECRRFDKYQENYADLGVIVSQNERKKGLATKILLELRCIARGNKLKPICSTTPDNIGAKKAIIKAGFISINRIVEFRNIEY